MARLNFWRFTPYWHYQPHCALIAEYRAERRNVITERIFTENLKKQLHERIKGDLFVHIVDDKLVVDIQPAALCTYRYTLDNIRVNIATGLSSTNVANDTVKKYKKYILSQYFFT